LSTKIGEIDNNILLFVKNNWIYTSV